MKQYLLLFLFSFAFLLTTKAQDQIFTTDGQVIKAHILEIKESEISYQTFDNLEGPVYFLSKKSIKKIVFESGIEETFNHSGTQIDPYQPKKNTKVTKPDKIYTTDGKEIECEVVEKKRFGVNYIPAGSQTNYVEYLANSKIDRIEYAEGEVEYISGNPKNGSRKDSRDFSYLSPHYISLMIGPSFPFGAFGSNQGGGYAGIGFSTRLDGMYYLFRGLGFGATFGQSWNPYGDPYFRNMLSSSIPSTATDVRISNTDWNHIYAMASVGYYNDFGRLLLEYKAMGGVLQGFYPVTEATYTDNGTRVREKYSGGESTSFIFGGYSGVRYYLTRKWSISGGLTMMFGKGNYNRFVYEKYVDGVPTNQSVLSGQQELPISWIMLHVGAAFTLGK